MAEKSHKLKCPKCDHVQSAKNDTCSECGHSLKEARKAKFANMGGGDGATGQLFLGDHQHGASVYQSELALAGAKEHNGLIYKVVCKTGSLALSPGPGQMDVEQPLELTQDLFQKVKSAWDDGAVRYVTLPETHDNGTFENKGYVKDLQILDQEGVKQLLGQEAFDVIKADDTNTLYMAAGLLLTNPAAKEAVLEGSVADMSVGIKFNGRPNKHTGKLYPAYLEHVAFTNQPWVDGLIPFSPAAVSAQGQVFDQEQDERTAVPWDGVFMTAATSPQTPSTAEAQAETAVDAPSDATPSVLKGLADNLGMTVEDLKKWGLEVEDPTTQPETPLAASQRASTLPSTMPERKTQKQTPSLEQILADQTARLETAEAQAEEAKKQAAAATGALLAQGKQLHTAQVKERIRELQLSGVPPAVLLAAKAIMSADNDLDRDEDGSLKLSQTQPKEGAENGETETIEVKLSSPSEICEFLLAAMPRGERPDLEVVGDLQDLHASQQEKKAPEVKTREQADAIEKRTHPERFDEDGKRKEEKAAS